MLRSRIPLIAAALALLLLAAPASAQETSQDPATQAAERAAAEAAAAAQIPRPTFVPAADGWGGCVNVPPAGQPIAESTIPGTWQVSAPRGRPRAVRPGDLAVIGLRDKYGTLYRGEPRVVYAEVYRPDGGKARAGTILVGDETAELRYPKAFAFGQPLLEGVYTVIWRDNVTDGFIACDGFVVAPA